MFSNSCPLATSQQAIHSDDPLETSTLPYNDLDDETLQYRAQINNYMSLS